MHVTLVLSFPCSIHRRDWPIVMAELQLVTMERRVRRATVEFRDELYANDLLPSYMEHASRWRHVSPNCNTAPSGIDAVTPNQTPGTMNVIPQQLSSTF